MVTEEDRERFHQLLDYALDMNEEYVIAQYARMNLDFNIKREIYRLHFKKNDRC